MSVLRRAKLRTPDGIESIEYPLGVDAENVEVANGENLSQRLARIDEDLEKNEEDIAAVNELAGINKQNIGANEIRIDALERRSASVNKKPYYFDTVADMKAYQELKAGDMVITLGYYSPNDGGGATYLIREKTSSDVEDGGSIHFTVTNLVSELIVENETVNVKQFGAKGDGETDDTEKIKKAIGKAKNLYFPSGTYKIISKIIITNGRYFGDVETVFNLEMDGEYQRIFENSNFWNSSNKDKIIIENIIFNSNTSGDIIGLANTIDVVIKKCTFNKTADVTGTGIDVYSNNTNFIIRDNTFNYNPDGDTRLRTPIEIREFSATQITSDVYVLNNTIYKNGGDETLWVDAWRGALRNIYIENNRIENTSGTANNMIWISGNANNSGISNVSVTNNYIYKEKLSYRMFAIGDSQGSPENMYVQNIKIHNNTIICNGIVENITTSFLFHIGKYLSSTGLNIDNNIIKNSSSDKISAFVYSPSLNDKAFSKNNRYYGACKKCIVNINSSKNDFYNGTCESAYKNVPLIEGCEVYANALIYNEGNSIEKYVIKNCLVNCKKLLASTGEKVQSNYKFINCIIKNTSTLFEFWNPVNGAPRVELLNCDISEGQKLSNTATSFILYINNLTKNGVSINNIPSNENDRGVLAVGTSFISSNSGKIIIRKISQGKDVSNWEEL